MEEKGYYLNDEKEGISFWEFHSYGKQPNSIILELKDKPVGRLGNVIFYRSKMFLKDDIGKKIFVTLDEAISNIKITEVM